MLNKQSLDCCETDLDQLNHLSSVIIVLANFSIKLQLPCAGKKLHFYTCN